MKKEIYEYDEENRVITIKQSSIRFKKKIEIPYYGDKKIDDDFIREIMYDYMVCLRKSVLSLDPQELRKEHNRICGVNASCWVDINNSNQVAEYLFNSRKYTSFYTKMGTFWEMVAVLISFAVDNGVKFEGQGQIDLFFERGKSIHLGVIKSGTNWANASSRKDLLSHFKKAEYFVINNNEINNKDKEIIFEEINLIGEKGNKKRKEGYYQYSGADAWGHLSRGDDGLWNRIRNIHQEIIGKIGSFNDRDCFERYREIIKNEFYSGTHDDIFCDYSPIFKDSKYRKNIRNDKYVNKYVNKYELDSIF